MRPATTFDAEVGERLFLWREAVGWTGTEMARRTEINRTSLSLIENGRSDPHLVTVRRIARAFGVSVDEFLYGEVPERK